MGSVLYGAGLRLMEGVRLRVKEVDFADHHITVRDGQGGQDRVTMRPRPLATPLTRHLAKVKLRPEEELLEGSGGWGGAATAYGTPDPFVSQRQYSLRWRTCIVDIRVDRGLMRCTRMRTPPMRRAKRRGCRWVPLECSRGRTPEGVGAKTCFGIPIRQDRILTRYPFA